MTAGQQSSTLSPSRPPADMRQPSSRLRTYVVGCDARSDIQVFSGTTFHLALQGVRDGLLTGMVNLYPKGLSGWPVYARAGWWYLVGSIRGRRHGFKFTNEYLDAIWKRHLPALHGSTIINNFQVFGPRFLRSYESFGILPYVYVDATLTEWFNTYRPFEAAILDETAMRRAIAVERAGYASCRKVVVMSKRSAAHIVADYGVPRTKVHVVPPGANIPEYVIETLESRLGPRLQPEGRKLVVGFAGYAYERKGLPTIAEAVRLLRHAGYDVRLHIIGNCPPEIAQRDGVTHFGLIDKSVEMDRFLGIVGRVDVACMLSRAENAGIALLEFLRLGVPIIGTDVGGIPDIVELGAGELVAPEISAVELAQLLARLIDEPYRLAELRERAWRLRHNASWGRAVQALKGLLERVSGQG
jgi:glycosyltransferase involved in cell wall biosynthesis